MLKILLLLIISSISLSTSSASVGELSLREKLMPLVPQPTACINGAFSTAGNQNWVTVSLTLTNNCAAAADFQNSTITFNNSVNLNTTFWGNFSPLSYPINNPVISSQFNGTNYTSSLSLQFTVASWSNTKLLPGQSITIMYGESTATYDPTSVKVYLSTTPPTTTGTIVLTNSSAQPANVSQSYAVIDVANSAQQITKVQLPWSGSLSLAGLTPGTYTIQPESVLDTLGNTYKGSANPSSVLVTANASVSSRISYTEVIQPGSILFTVAALPSQISGYTSTPSITLTNTSNGSTIISSVPWNASTSIGQLINNTSYSFSTSVITFNGYNCTGTFNPTKATSSTTPPTVQLTYQCIQAIQPPTNGRIIGYMPGWLTPPSPTAMAAAGYTNVIVAFGVFSTTSPGQITNAFSTVTPSYIAQLHSAGLKVSLSLGGASTSLPNTTVNFDQVLQASSGQAAFVSTFVQSLESLISQYGFDGVDFDIEQGFIPQGTFTNPTGDIAALAAIINNLRANNPNLLISLAPQAANISATSGFNQTFGNYSSLIMQVADALTWVGVQIYNTGCVLGINQVCYGTTASPDFSVVVAVDLLASWPSTIAGRSTGFQPYISYLKPNQIVLGYPAPDNTGASDGSPVTPAVDIIRAFQCLQTGIAGSNSCDTYVPPQAYPGIGGVFEWELNYDEANNFQFATALRNCVLNGNCN